MPATKRPRAASDSGAGLVKLYFAKLPPGTRTHLRALRSAIKAAAPGSTDGFGYGIPSVRVDGRVVVYYAAFTAHVSVYPIDKAFAKDNAAALKGYYTSGKGTLRFSLEQSIPKLLVKRLVLHRLATLKGPGGRPQ